MSAKLAIAGGEPVRRRPFPSWPEFGREEEQALLRTVRSGKWWSVEGDEVASFERLFAAQCGAKHGIAVTSGTAALRLALWAAGVRAGDEVIVPPFTFVATASAVVEANATPVFVDVDADTYNLDPGLIEAAITPRTKAIIPVHFAGRAADMGRIMEIARARGLTVIEDAAHAQGGALAGRGLGSIGDLGCFSFQASKNLNCGEGGFITTSDDGLAAEVRAIHNFGRRPGSHWYEHNVMSSNYRMTEFQGAILSAQLRRLPEQTERREANAERLSRRLRQVPGIRPQPRGEDETRKAYHLYLMRFDEREWGVPRRDFLEAMRAEGIPAGAGYVMPVHRQEIFTRPDFGPFTAAFEQHPGLDYNSVSCPVSERACDFEVVWMPQSVLLGTPQDMDDVASAFEKVYDCREQLSAVGSGAAP